LQRRVGGQQVGVGAAAGRGRLLERCHLFVQLLDPRPGRPELTLPVAHGRLVFNLIADQGLDLPPQRLVGGMFRGIVLPHGCQLVLQYGVTRQQIRVALGERFGALGLAEHAFFEVVGAVAGGVAGEPPVHDSHSATDRQQSNSQNQARTN